MTWAHIRYIYLFFEDKRNPTEIPFGRLDRSGWTVETLTQAGQFMIKYGKKLLDKML